MNAAHILVALQVSLGLLIMAGGVVVAASSMDRRSHRLQLMSVVGLIAWGCWLALVPFVDRRVDSPPALAFAGLVVYVLLRHGREVRAILDGAEWWPPNAGDVELRVTVLQKARRPARPWWQKLNPWWLLVANDDDGYFGDDKWRAGRPKTWGLAWSWWWRNPAHNLTWYGLGVADRERTTTGRWGGEFHRPGGGLLVCWTHVEVCGLMLTLPFVSYISRWTKWYAGWRPSGAFGFKLNISRRGEIEVKS